MTQPLPSHLRALLDRMIDALDAAEAGPSSEDLAAAPLLQNWIPVRPRREPPVLWGDVTGHPLIGPGPISTSQLALIDPAAGWARTASRFYRLGQPSFALGDPAKLFPDAAPLQIVTFELEGADLITDLDALQLHLKSVANRIRAAVARDEAARALRH